MVPEATFVVRRDILPGPEREYDDGLRRFIAKARDALGCRSITVVVLGGGSTVGVATR